MKDLAALNKVEMLPWDESGPDDGLVLGCSGAEYDQLIDTVAAICATDDTIAVAALYAARASPRRPD